MSGGRALGASLALLVGGLLSSCSEADAPESEAHAPPRVPQAAVPSPVEVSAEEAEALRALGYVPGSEPARERSGVVVHDRSRAFQGINLVVSGHAPEATLVDMQGRVLHRWSYDGSAHYPIQPYRNYWVRVRVLEDGALLAIFDPHGIVKLDRSSNLIWASDDSERIHHDLAVDDRGRIYALGKQVGRVDEIHEGANLIQDHVVVYDADGRFLERFSLLDAFRSSPIAEKTLAKIRENAAAQRGRRPIWLPEDDQGLYVEDFHTNTIEWLDGSLAHISPVLARGNLLFCSPKLNNVWIVDGKTHAVIWNWFGPWKGIHQPTLLATGTFLLFHNDMKGRRRGPGAASEVLEFAFPSARPVWRYGGDPEQPATRFYSWCCGSVERLPNGNTLIVSTGEGRGIEVTPEGDIVWEFVNPERTGVGDALVASLFQMERYAPGPWLEWLEAPAP